MDLYEVIGVPKDATQAAIKTAYRMKAQKLHPDKEGGDNKAFQALQQAYEVLSDPERRKRYDETGSVMPGIDIIGEARSKLANLFLQAVDHLDVDNENVVNVLHSKLCQMESGLEAERQKVEKAIRKKESALSRMTYNGKGTDLVRGVIERSIMDERSKFDVLEQHAKVINKMQDMLTEYAYQEDVRTTGGLHGTMFGEFTFFRNA